MYLYILYVISIYYRHHYFRRMKSISKLEQMKMELCVAYIWIAWICIYYERVQS